MHKLIPILLVTCALAYSAETPDINILQDNGNSIIIEYQLQGYDIEQVDINGQLCSRIIVPGQAKFLEKGLPELPKSAQSIIIPDDESMSYRILDIEFETMKIGTIIPSKGNLLRSVDPKTIPYTFAEFYQMDSWWPEKTIELSEPFILRDYRGLTIRFNPFQYNPTRNELKVVKRIIVEVYENGKGGANVITKKRNSVIREFVGIYKQLFLNFNEARYDSITERAGRMVIITADDYADQIQEFVAWKRQKGINAKMVTISSIGGNTESNIKTCIQDEYDAGELVWVLLVGDGNEVRPATGTVGDATGADADPVYAYTAGSDYYPDIFISRFSSRNGDSIAILKQVSRSILYEKTPQLGADWYHVGLGVASNLTGGTSYADSTRMNWLRDSLLNYTYTEVNKSYDPWGTSSLIKNYIEAGTGIINYIGHGSTYGWGNGGGFSTSNINSLDNPWMLPFVISVACLVGNFDGHDCFCEVSVTAGTVDTADGFLVHWGSTINQSWVPPCYGQEGAVNLLTHDEKNTAGGIFFNGACYMIEKQGALGMEMAQTWHIFGDASVQLRTNTPQEMTVDHADSINRSQATFDVSVTGVEDALVGLYADTMFVASGYTDASGNVTIEVDNLPEDADVMSITVTAYNKIPYMNEITIYPPGIEETENNSGLSAKTSLISIYPNPFCDVLTIKYSIGRSTTGIVLAIYNSAGQLVRQYDHTTTRLSDHVIWDGCDDSGHSVPGGVYFVHFRVDDYRKIEKAILLK